MKTGQDILNKMITILGDDYVLGILVPKNDPNWPGPFDCAEALSWAVYQVVSTLYGCNRDTGDPATADAGTIYWDQDSRRLGKIIAVDEAARISGAAVLRVSAAGRYGHIVMSDGQGGTVEAQCTATGVVRSTLHGRRWDRGILVPGLEYESGPPAPVVPPSFIYRLTSPMMQDQMAKTIQSLLGIEQDGIYGPVTMAAVIAFQKAHGLVVDGEVGPLTFKALGG